MKKAFSLALTLWIVAIMSLVSALYLNYGKKVITKTTLLNNKLRLTLKAESIVELIKFYGSTGSIRFNFIENSRIKKQFPSFPTKVFIDSRNIVWDNTTITLQDSAGLIDIRDIEAISSYIAYDFQNIKEKKAIIIDSMEDWLDIDSFSRLSGAEDSFYKNFKYGARDKDYFATTEELFLLRGLKDYNGSKKENFESLLVVSDQITRNILTLRGDMLQRIYNISKSDMAQLQQAKDENVDRFIALFKTIYKENYNFERDAIFPSGIIRVKIISSNKNLKKEILFLIDFVQGGGKSFEVLEYKD